MKWAELERALARGEPAYTLLGCMACGANAGVPCETWCRSDGCDCPTHAARTAQNGEERK